MRARTGALAALAALAACGAVGAADAEARRASGHGGVDHYVRSTPENVVWGGFPIDKPAIATVRSGETVRIDTISHAGATSTALTPDQYFGAFGVKPGEILKDVYDFNASIPTRVKYGGGHVLTGPVYIEGAEPGDTLEIQILDVEPRVPYGVNNTGHNSGVFSETYPGWREGDVLLDIPEAPADAPGGLVPDVRQHLYRTGRYRGRDVAFFDRDIKIPLSPFQGIMATAPRDGVFVTRLEGDPPPADGVQASTPPGEYGGNLDVKDLGAGSTLYLPVFQDGAQFYTGDPHSLQGDGEVSGTAIEHSNTGTFRFILHKGTTIDGPWAEDEDFYYLMGITHDLDRAMKFSVMETIRFLVEEKGLTIPKAYSLASIAVDFVNSEVVDGTQVVSCKIPKSIFRTGRKDHDVPDGER